MEISSMMTYSMFKPISDFLVNPSTWIDDDDDFYFRCPCPFSGYKSALNYSDKLLLIFDMKIK